MKAKVKETGEIIEVMSLYSVTYSRLDCNGKIIEEYDEDELDFDFDKNPLDNKNLEISNKEENEHWQNVRERAAIAAMQGMLSCGEYAFSYQRITETEKIVEVAVNYANALIKQLKEK